MMPGSDAGQMELSIPISGTCGRDWGGEAGHVRARPVGDRETVNCRAGRFGRFRQTMAPRATADKRRLAARMATVPVVQW